LREERRLFVFENRVLRRIFGPKGDEVTGSGGNYVVRSLMICTPNQIFGDHIDKNGIVGVCDTCGRQERDINGVLVGRPEGKATWKT
jgi:hypothetical protein